MLGLILVKELVLVDPEEGLTAGIPTFSLRGVRVEGGGGGGALHCDMCLPICSTQFDSWFPQLVLPV